MNHTLSTTQWQMLQDLFDQSVGLDEVAIDALLAKARSDDPRVAQSLQAMLDAHEHWRSRTGDAVEHLAREVQVSAVGSRLGAFRLVSEIGRGGMGVVYLGERVDGQVQQQVAIKVLHTHNLDLNTRTRFQSERDILAQFDHVGIARLLDAGESQAAEPYFVMEYLRGAPIAEYCDRNRLGVHKRLKLFLRVCDAVHYAHGNLILHRDIKSSNIIVDGSGVPRLIDFGIAKPLRTSAEGEVDVTVYAQRFFSPANAAPEQILGSPVAVTCDVYQLGTLLYELLCGQSVFDLHGKSAAEIERQICESTPRQPSERAALSVAETARARGLTGTAALRRALSGDLDAIVQRALRKKPTSRYTSVIALSDDIKRHLDNRPVHGRRGGSWYRLSRFSQRHWQSLSVAGLVLVGLIMFANLLIGLQRQTARERDIAIVEGRHSKAISDFLVDMFDIAGPSAVGGPETPIRVALARGEEMLDLRTDVDPSARARLLSALSRVSINLGELENSEIQIRKAIQLLEEGSPLDLPLLAEQYQLASGALGMLEKNEQAATMARRAVEIYDSLDLGVESSWYARLNLLRIAKNDSPSAACAGMEQLLRNIKIALDAPPESLAIVLKETSRCRSGTAEGLERNDKELRDAIQYISRTLGPNDHRAFQLKQVLSRNLLLQKRSDEASELLKQILPAQIQVYGEESWSVAFSFRGLGNIAFEDKNYLEAEDYLMRAHRILVVVHGSRASSDVAMSSFTLGRIHDVGFNDLSKASTFYEEAINSGRAAFGPLSQEVASFSANYGVLLLRMHDPKRAEPYLRTATEILTAADSDGVRARIALAKVLLDKSDLTGVGMLLREAEGGIADIVLDDARFIPEVDELRSSVASLEAVSTF